MKLLSLFLISLHLAPCTFAAVNPPDFTVQVGNEQNAKMQGWLLLFLPPEHHHFNLAAPMKVSSSGLDFIKVGGTEAKVGYRLSNPALKEGAPAEAELFLCDEAKTYCVKKTLNFVLKINSELHQLDFKSEPSVKDASPKPKKKKVSKKDESGFWDNDLDSAVADASQTHRPLLIDFYGIWCPPCNLLNETVFSKAKFKQAAKSWVLLKMDADSPESFALKSHFKVGGYPTLIAMKTPEIGTAALNGEEIDRVVGFYPENELVVKINKLYGSRAVSLDEQYNQQKEKLAQTLTKLIEVKLEKKEMNEALLLTSEGERSYPNDSFFALQSLAIRANERPELLRDPKNGMLIKAVAENRERESTETLLKLEDLLVSQAEHLSPEQIRPASAVLDTLAKRVNPKTLSVPGVELSIGDLSSLRVDVADALKDDGLKKKAYAEGVQSYLKLIELYHGKESRGLNLELAYLYSKSGEIQKAKGLYSHFIAKFPEEFTFYFAASRMYLELKELAVAREYAEKAVKLSYGDNQIRATERLVRIMNAQGEKAKAAGVGREYLGKAAVQAPELAVRTNRYLQSLQKAVDEAEKI